ncbi:hypothetical protein ROZALSC1DRAFT_28123 [Rozella allomycis CSF55]|uniref:Uncharacterized protein n=1 Tax=Rozella allomycis (strain CSF55) TaxID=988480 RepID=A0A075ATF3_ROZAC|nr:hypothetical protein O9G_001201 [Rozella allomycis CSF55]RKP20373.1 hypothetical protein ROZALSC1DRAFT_28123 [Rozella allomycis CSF55]|eukprot:EPZ33450.1 hypothetical protein O9G_001201 [Rozella allomycis CSF55]
MTKSFPSPGNFLETPDFLTEKSCNVLSENFFEIQSFDKIRDSLVFAINENDEKAINILGQLIFEEFSADYFLELPLDDKLAAAKRFDDEKTPLMTKAVVDNDFEMIKAQVHGYGPVETMSSDTYDMNMKFYRRALAKAIELNRKEMINFLMPRVLYFSDFKESDLLGLSQNDQIKAVLTGSLFSDYWTCSIL